MQWFSHPVLERASCAGDGAALQGAAGAEPAIAKLAPAVHQGAPLCGSEAEITLGRRGGHAHDWLDEVHVAIRALMTRLALQEAGPPAPLANPLLAHVAKLRV